MECVFQKYLTTNGNYGLVENLNGLMLETKSKSDVAINRKVNRQIVKEINVIFNNNL